MAPKGDPHLFMFDDSAVAGEAAALGMGLLYRVSWAVPGSAAFVRWLGARRARRGGFARQDFFSDET